MKKVIFCGILLLALAGCADEKDKNARPHREMEYSGRVICPRCQTNLDNNLFEQPGQLVECPACKGKAPRGAYCPDMKK